ncbi:DnaJ C-terminal domain-containing protein [Polyangium sp. y55x31]|uniref:DnaJ C-terminal domain-containing protein n=1 Tax=Polyangium sp. y55x31 TaxID=3042688 RepID=UPI002482F6F5|nr:DnaJ C-terminal domain-containing protein [Polyangium sp. y55x31]MDI1482066.1 DnaJ C-terminal domain-containing protein [Polyangium sp. y55x31]
MARDLYSVLGVARDADEDTIKKAFRKLAVQYHPDKAPGKANEAKFKEINRAYEVLSDKQKRSLYDEFGEDSLQQGFDPERARFVRQYGGGRGRAGGAGGGAPFNVEEIFGGGGGGGGVPGDFGDLFGDMFGRIRGGGARGARAARKGQDVESEVTIDFVSAVKGTTVQLQREGEEPMTVRIPAGANEGSRIRVPGQGAPGMGGGPAGDLLLTIHVTPHPLFKREGDDLRLDVPVSIGEAYFGGKVKVPTPDGEVTLKVPAHTQSGQVLRLKGKGVARKGKEAGDLYVRFLIHVRTEEDPRVAEAVKELDLPGEELRRELRF